MGARAIRTTIGLLLCLAGLLAGCVPPPLPIGAPPTAMPTAAPAPTATPSATPEPSPEPTRTPPPSATPTPEASPTPAATELPLLPTPTLAPVAAEQRTQIFEQVWTLVRDRYVYPDYGGVDWQAVRDEFAPRVAASEEPEQFYTLIREMIDRLGDEHSRFESPQQVAASQAEFEGGRNYAGIGARVRDVPEGGLITGLVPGGPAEQAGLRLREVIVAIDGIRFTDEDAFGPLGPLGRVRGEPGSAVVLTVRAADGAEREVSITRRVISGDAFPDVEAQRIAGTNVGLVTINTFYADGLPEQVRDLIAALASEGPIEGLILDVRSNGGGRIDLMLNTLALFVDGGSIGVSSGRGRENRISVPRGQTMPELRGVPVAVLIGEESVSAAEMFAGGMRARERATLVGMPTAGNVENLTIHTLPDGSQLWLAENVYRLPGGTTVEGVGVQPDRLIAADWWLFEPADDPQIQAAIEELRAQSTGSAVAP